MSIPEGAVEAGWAVLAELMECDIDDHGIYELDLMRGLNAALEAAAPIIAAKAWDEGAAAAVLDVSGLIDHPPNPYRT